MALITLPTTFVDNTVPTAAQFNGNFQAIIAAVNGNINAANVDSTSIATLSGSQSLSNKTIATPIIITSPPYMTAGTAKGALSESLASERGQAFPCHVNSAGNKYVGVHVYFPVPFLNDTGLTITISSEELFAPSSNTDLAAASTKATTNIYDADNKVIGFSRSYLNNTSFTGNTAYLVQFSWSATRT